MFVTSCKIYVFLMMKNLVFFGQLFFDKNASRYLFDISLNRGWLCCFSQVLFRIFHCFFELKNIFKKSQKILEFIVGWYKNNDLENRNIFNFLTCKRIENKEICHKNFTNYSKSTFKVLIINISKLCAAFCSSCLRPR